MQFMDYSKFSVNVYNLFQVLLFYCFFFWLPTQNSTYVKVSGQVSGQAKKLIIVVYKTV